MMSYHNLNSLKLNINGSIIPKLAPYHNITSLNLSCCGRIKKLLPCPKLTSLFNG